jgi:hypothetical protein
MRSVSTSEQASLIQSAPTILERFSKGITITVEVPRLAGEAADPTTDISHKIASCKENKDRSFGKSNRLSQECNTGTELTTSRTRAGAGVSVTPTQITPISAAPESADRRF